MHILAQTIRYINLQVNIAISYGDFKLFNDLLQDAEHSTATLKHNTEKYKLEVFYYVE